MKSNSKVKRQVGFRQDPINPVWDSSWEWRDPNNADIDPRNWSQDM